jgi:hypothetical protein
LNCHPAHQLSFTTHRAAGRKENVQMKSRYLLTLLLMVSAIDLRADLWSFSYTEPTGTVLQTEPIVINIEVTNDSLSTTSIVRLFPVSLQFVLLPPGAPPVITQHYSGAFLLGGVDLDIAPGDSVSLDAYLYTPTGPFPPDGTVFQLLEPRLIAEYSDLTQLTVAPSGAQFSRTITAVPEPSSLVLLAVIGVLIELLLRRGMRRRL